MPISLAVSAGDEASRGSASRIAFSRIPGSALSSAFSINSLSSLSRPSSVHNAWTRPTDEELVLATFTRSPAASSTWRSIIQGALAGPVWTHDRVDLSLLNVEVYALEDLLALDCRVEILDIQLAHSSGLPVLRDL